MRYRQHRKDRNHDELSEKLEKRGWLLFDVHNVDAFVDQIAVRGGRVVFIEYKHPTTSKARKEKPSQMAVQAALRRQGAEVAVVETEADLSQFERL